MPTLHLTDISVRGLRGSAKYETFFDTQLPAFGVRCGLRRKTFIVMRGRNRERVTIGHYPDMSLADARKEAKRLLSSEPEAKKQPVTFEAARDEFLKEHYAGKASAWPGIVKLLLNKHFKKLNTYRLADITDGDIRSCLDRVEGQSAKVHAFRAIRTFMRWATRPPRRYLSASPMDGYAAPGRDTKRSRTLSNDELVRVWNASHEGSKRVFQLIILWGTRSAETARLQRSWIAGDVLTIPGSHTKNGRALPIPLTPLATTVLNCIPNTGEFFFPSRRGNEQSIAPGSLAGLRQEVQEKSETDGWGAHDLRRTFRSNCARLGVSRDLAEALLNHAPPVLDEIYDQYDRIPERREALAKHEVYLTALLKT